MYVVKILNDYEPDHWLSFGYHGAQRRVLRPDCAVPFETVAEARAATKGLRCKTVPIDSREYRGALHQATQLGAEYERRAREFEQVERLAELKQRAVEVEIANESR